MVTIEEYLRGYVSIPLTDETIKSILADRGVDSGADLSELDEKAKDLCKADAFFWVAGAPRTRTSVEDVNGVWKHKEGGYTLSDDARNRYLALARAIYYKYGLLPPVSKRITTKSYGFRLHKQSL